jgi:hypothetical protein
MASGILETGDGLRRGEHVGILLLAIAVNGHFHDDVPTGV